MNLSVLKSEHKKRKKEIKARLNDFKETSHFYELCFCILTPQSNAFKCDECIKILKNRNFLKNDFEIKNILKKYTRFYRNKSTYLNKIKRDWNKICPELSKIKDKRDYLVKNVKGIGMKEASHFLRNIGYRNFAILDRHILKNLKNLNVISEIPKSLTREKYLEIEERFRNFAKKIKIPMDELDLLFWSMETGKVFK